MRHVLENHVTIKKMFMWKVRNYFNELLLSCWQTVGNIFVLFERILSRDRGTSQGGSRAFPWEPGQDVVP